VQELDQVQEKEIKYDITTKKDKLFNGGRSDEGAWIAHIDDEEAFEVLANACEEVSSELGFACGLGVDLASSSLWDGKQKKLQILNHFVFGNCCPSLLFDGFGKTFSAQFFSRVRSKEEGFSTSANTAYSNFSVHLPSTSSTCFWDDRGNT
jgi:hypothetical protein